MLTIVAISEFLTNCKRCQLIDVIIQDLILRIRNLRRIFSGILVCMNLRFHVSGLNQCTIHYLARGISRSNESAVNTGISSFT